VPQHIPFTSNSRLIFGHVRANRAWRLLLAAFIEESLHIYVDARTMISSPSLMLSYDTRDSLTILRHGNQVVVFAGLTTGTSSVRSPYSLFGIDVRHFRRLVTGLRSPCTLRFAISSWRLAPFWALSHLGGDRSSIGYQQPLRGFGSGRFVDNNLFVSNKNCARRCSA